MAEHLKTFLDRRLEALSEEWSGDDLALAKQVAADIVDLTIQGLAGGDVAAELDQAKAAAAAIAVGAELSVAKAINEGVTDFVENLLDRLLL